jgi:outer membrane protein TolC
VASSARGLEDARRRLVLEVAAAFYTIVRQQRLVHAGERALDRAANLRRASEARTKVGLATRLDVLRAELLAAQAEAYLATQREGLADGADRLKVLVGRPIEQPLEIAVDGPLANGVADALPIAPAAVDGLVAVAYETRLELREARDRVADAERDASVARWKLLPDVSLSASYTQRGLGAPERALFPDRFGGWRLAVVTSYGLDRTSLTAATERAGIAARAARRAVADLEQQAAAEVRRAWRARARAAASVEIQAKAVELAQKQLRLAQLRYERGLAGNFDVVDAEAHVFAAESGLIAAEVETALAALALEHAVGTLDPERYAR